MVGPASRLPRGPVMRIHVDDVAAMVGNVELRSVPTDRGMNDKAELIPLTGGTCRCGGSNRLKLTRACGRPLAGEISLPRWNAVDPGGIPTEREPQTVGNADARSFGVRDRIESAAFGIRYGPALVIDRDEIGLNDIALAVEHRRDPVSRAVPGILAVVAGAGS
jgi:hypothetical protein